MARNLPLEWISQRLAMGVLCCAAQVLTAETNVNVLTYHNDLARSGANLSETVLTLTNVNENSFGKHLTHSVDGFVYAQPLYMTGVSIPGKGLHNVVFVATEHNSVYAFDADSNQGDNATPLWHVSFIDPAAGITTVPYDDYGWDDAPAFELGITGTPVIDPAAGTLYVVAKIKDTSTGTAQYPQRLYALDIHTGAAKFGAPVDIQGSAFGSGWGSDGRGNLPFNPFWHLQRPGLLLLNGVVYIGFASHGDGGPYHGWIFGYDALTLQRRRIFNATPDGYQGGIWMSGGAPAVDAAGNIYCITGNGLFDADKGLMDFGNSFLKLVPAGTNLVVTDYFTPYNYKDLDVLDIDLGSSGPLLLPDSVGSAEHPRLLVACGKEGVIYLLDRDNMGHYNPNDDSQIVQSFRVAQAYRGAFGAAAYFNNLIYYGCSGDFLKAYSISNGRMSESPVSQSSARFGFPGTSPSISANGTNNAIVWAILAEGFRAGASAVLYAYNATNLAEQLYSSVDAGTRDQLGLAQKFSVPVIANGKVYVGTGGGLSVFGTLGNPVITTQPQSQTTETGADATFYVAANGTLPFTYQWQFNGTNIDNGTNAWLTMPKVQLQNTGDYTVKVSNAFDEEISHVARLEVSSTQMQPQLGIDSRFWITIQGQPGQTYAIEHTEALTTGWERLTTITLHSSTQWLGNLGRTNGAHGFYRAVLGSF